MPCPPAAAITIISWSPGSGTSIQETADPRQGPSLRLVTTPRGQACPTNSCKAVHVCLRKVRTLARPKEEKCPPFWDGNQHVAQNYTQAGGAGNHGLCVFGTGGGAGQPIAGRVSLHHRGPTRFLMMMTGGLNSARRLKLTWPIALCGAATRKRESSQLAVTGCLGSASDLEATAQSSQVASGSDLRTLKKDSLSVDL